MRTDQMIGLSPRGQKLVADPNLTRVQHTLLEGAFGNTFPLYEWRLPIWQYADTYKMTLVLEEVQASPWSSGPCFFLALKDKESREWIKESLWTNQEMEEYL
ncbi:MAG: hypothetical protein ACXADB_12910 [Candidatus Hermodarchaeia archaeon]|jgi:hypothetical protein